MNLATPVQSSADKVSKGLLTEKTVTLFEARAAEQSSSSTSPLSCKKFTLIGGDALFGCDDNIFKSAVHQPLKLVVESVHTNQLALTNCVYINLQDMQQLQSCNNRTKIDKLGVHCEFDPLQFNVQVGDHAVFYAKASEEVNVGRILLSMLQRRSAFVSLDQQVSVSAFEASEAGDGCELSGLMVEVEPLTKSAHEAKPEVSRDDLSAQFHECFKGHIFNNGQLFSMELDGLKYVCKITGMNLATPVQSSADKVSKGLLTEKTVTLFEAGAAKQSSSLPPFTIVSASATACEAR
jgi:hypothetical protein